MRTVFVCLLVLLTAISVSAQRNLSSSHPFSPFSYIYKITAREAEKLTSANLENVDESYLHTLVDSFKTGKGAPDLQPCNYLFVGAKKNQLVYRLETVGDVDVKIINNDHDVAVLVHTRQGTAVANATVSLDRQRLSYNSDLKLYGPFKAKKGRWINVYHDSIYYVFPLGLHQPQKPTLLRGLAYSAPLKYVVQPIRKLFTPNHRYASFFNGSTDYEQKFKGFMVFSKPMYKPGDTVQLKAFVETNSGRAVTKPLILRLTNRLLDVDTVLTTLKPVQAGSYVYSFVLSDSMDLDLDEDYLFTLEEERSRKYDLSTYDGDLEDDQYAMKRKVLVRGKFRYEEYELDAITFSARSSRSEHNRGQEVALYLKAADENGMAVMDGQVQILVQPEEWGSKAFHAPKLFLPDTLWYHEQLLENLGETKIVLPDSIFPKASFNYQVQCRFLNANNEMQSETLRQQFHDQTKSISFEVKKDSLFIDHFDRDKSVPVSGKLYVFNQNKDTIEQRVITLPASVRLNPFASSYEVETNSLDENYEPRQARGMVSCLSSRTKDSIAIQLVNPQRLPVWYTIFAGDKVVARGLADSLFYLDRSLTKKNYFVSLQYVYANRVYKENFTIPFQDKRLNIQVRQPEQVYPGQTVPIEINVQDAAGKPVADADITAYAYTAKFHTQVPFIPYLGKMYPLRKQRPGLYLKEAEALEYEVQLNWKRWSTELRLDTVEYYKFLHPAGLYQNGEPAPDSLTQLAPFVVRNGELQPIHLLYIDERPVFFSQVQQLKRYSFPVSEGWHRLRMRTQNALISLDSLWVEKGVKTFLSVEGDTANHRIRIEKMPDTLTAYEKSLWGKYLLLVANNFGENFAYVRQNANVYLLNQNQTGYRTWILAGPFPNNDAQLVVKNGFEQDFVAEGSWQYTITKGLVKQKQYNAPFALSSHLAGESAAENFRDFVLTEKEIDSLWQDYLDNRSATTDLFYNTALKKTGNGRLQIDFSNSLRQKNLFIKNVILFRYDNPDFIHIYSGKTWDLGYVQPGTYRLLFLLKEDKYFIHDSLVVQRDGLNFYEIGKFAERPKDSVSSRISRIIESRDQYNRAYVGEELNQIKESFNERYLDASGFSDQVTGVVRDNNGVPLVGAAVMIKGTRVGTTTNAMGEFSLKIPPHGTLVVTGIGFTSQEVRIRPEMAYSIVLKPAEQHLDEVVVVGYGVAKKQSLTGAVSSGSTDGYLMGKVAGVMIRGANTVDANNSPLIIVNGLPFSGRLGDLDQNAIAGMNVLKGEEATALYGARAAAGVILITTKQAKLNVDAGLPSPGASLRRNFRDDAYWQPTLRTDQNGKASFRVTFPDDITSWRTFVIAMGRQKQSGFAEGSIKSFKATSGSLALPQFAVTGDAISVIGKTLNYLPDSLQVKRSFFVNDQVRREDIIRLRHSKIDTFSVVATATDSLKVKYTIQKEDGYFDGEERQVPVFKPGVLETTGIFAALDRDTAFQLSFKSDTGKVKIYAEASLLPVLYEEAEAVRNYEYLCNEQLASKLKALLVQKKISPYLNRPFKGDAEIRDIINRLNKSKSASGLWGWWTGNEPTLWISLHVIEALVQAQQAGYATALNNTVLTDYLLYNLESYKPFDRISCLLLLKRLGAKPNYKKYIDTLEKGIANLNLYERLRLAELKQEAGLPVALDSLVGKQKQTAFGNLYWGEDRYQLFDNAVQNTLSMYRLLKKSGGYEAQLRKIRNYFLEKRSGGHWRNTYESSLILETILPDLLEEQQRSVPLTLTLKGADTITVKRFPFYTELPNKGAMTITKTGAAPVYFTAYQQHWNSTPAQVAGNFIVRSSFEKGGKMVSDLKAGEPVMLHVNVSVQADADFVLVEIPIPAGCSYTDKGQSFGGGEVHREYFKNKVCIFSKGMRKGDFTFIVSLLPRYDGRYTLNPAKAEMMYFPVFYGRETIKKVVIN
jgi:TonB-dependent SusC/RagA subfamily outer membrane receptor